MSIQSPNAKEDLQSINATENAISAVTKICKNVDSVPLDTILPIWLSWLPVLEDKEEAPHVYSYLCDLIERLECVCVYTNSHRRRNMFTIKGANKTVSVAGKILT